MAYPKRLEKDQKDEKRTRNVYKGKVSKSLKVLDKAKKLPDNVVIFQITIRGTVFQVPITGY
jgi:hypothetical protein